MFFLRGWVRHHLQGTSLLLTGRFRSGCADVGVQIDVGDYPIGVALRLEVVSSVDVSRTCPPDWDTGCLAVVPGQRRYVSNGGELEPLIPNLLKNCLSE